MNRSIKKVADIESGDFFHASSAEMESITCLALEVCNGIIRALDGCRGYEYEFDAVTGLALSGPGGEKCQIDSVAPLPEDHHIALRGMFNRYSNAKSDDAYALLEPKRKALLFIGPFYSKNRLI